jgi:hypothetical protein
MLRGTRRIGALGLQSMPKYSSPMRRRIVRNIR